MGDHRLRGFKIGGRNNKRMRFVDSGYKEGLNGWNRLRFFKNRRRNGKRWFVNHGHECLGWFDDRGSDDKRVDGHGWNNVGVVLDEFDRLGGCKYFLG